MLGVEHRRAIRILAVTHQPPGRVAQDRPVVLGDFIYAGRAMNSQLKRIRASGARDQLRFSRQRQIGERLGEGGLCWLRVAGLGAASEQDYTSNAHYLSE